MCVCECVIYANSMNFTLLTWCFSYLKKPKYQIHNANNRSSGEVIISICEEYKNVVIPHSSHIQKKHQTYSWKHCVIFHQITMCLLNENMCSIFVQAGLAINWNYFVRPFCNTSLSFSKIPRKPYNSNFCCHSETEWDFFFDRKKDTFITFFLTKKIPLGFGFLSKND